MTTIKGAQNAISEAAAFITPRPRQSAPDSSSIIRGQRAISTVPARWSVTGISPK
ncbi:MAG: hypothetical protein H6729_17800 [Deltaproteobacteria bacterium]|nr:hypothetical protein [Deltaproteobacteria bacterium]